MVAQVVVNTALVPHGGSCVCTGIGTRHEFSGLGKYENGQRSLDIIEFLEVAEAIGFDPGNFLPTLRNQANAGDKPGASAPVQAETPRRP